MESLGEDIVTMQMVIEAVASFKDSSDAVRRGIFARYTAMEKTILELEKRLSALESAHLESKAGAIWHYGLGDTLFEKRA